MNIIRAIELQKKIENFENTIHILKGVSLTVNSGETVAIMGASGSGKTTLLSLLAGLDLPTSGEIYLNNQLISTLNEDDRAQCRLKNVGFIFQNFDLLPHFTALENVMLPMELAGLKESKIKAAMLLESVGLLHRQMHFPSQLSGGEQQRVAIARAFSTSPKILFADEPTGNLDNVTAEKIVDLLFDLNRTQKTTLVIVTHDSVLSQRCSKVLQLKAGTLNVIKDQN